MSSESYDSLSSAAAVIPQADDNKSSVFNDNFLHFCQQIFTFFYRNEKILLCYFF